MKKSVLIYLTANVLFLAAICALIRQKTDINHVCNWVECPINDLGWKVPKEPVTDSECYVHCHFTNPSWEYERIEKYIFSPTQ